MPGVLGVMGLQPVPLEPRFWDRLDSHRAWEGLEGLPKVTIPVLAR